MSNELVNNERYDKVVEVTTIGNYFYVIEEKDKLRRSSMIDVKTREYGEGCWKN